MNLPTAVISCFRQWWSTEGRASRSEFWWWTLFTNLVPIPLGFADMAVFPQYHLPPPLLDGPFNIAFMVITFLPSFFVMIRRLHDVGRSGYWWMIAITGIGALVLLYWMVKKGTPGENRFGPDPVAKSLN